MRSPSKSVKKRITDADSELNLAPGFRFHPTDEELIVYYLCRKSQSTAEKLTLPPPPPIIADVDLYKHNPWELPDMALYGTNEWYFFTPRGRKYPNGSRPNRVTGNGYWKATGADKPINSKSDPNSTIGIKKALVFYAGKGVKGIKTNWIMHEYRLKPINPTISTVDDWVLCRLYNKKNDRNEMIMSEDALQKQNSCSNNNNNNDSFDSCDSYECSDGEYGGICENDAMVTVDHLQAESVTEIKDTNEEIDMGLMNSLIKTEDGDGNDWLDSLSLEDLHHCLEATPPNHDVHEPPVSYHQNRQHFFSWV